RAGQLTSYIKSIARGEDPVAAGKSAFGDFGKLDSELNVYVRQARFQSLLIPANKMSVGAISVRQLRPCEVQIINVRMRSAVGVNDKTAPDVADDAQHDAAGCENDVFVQRTLAETYY